jgi:hypothetical protein
MIMSPLERLDNQSYMHRNPVTRGAWWKDPKTGPGLLTVTISSRNLPQSESPLSDEEKRIAL